VYIETGAGTRFVGQHDARLQPDGTISVFDNASVSGRVLPSRAEVVRPDPASRTVSLVRSYRHPHGLLSTSMGNLQVLPDGHALVCWGIVPYVSEYSGPDPPSGGVRRPPLALIAPHWTQFDGVTSTPVSVAS